MPFGKGVARPVFEVILKFFRFIPIIEINRDLKFPWFKFYCVGRLSRVVFLNPFLEVRCQTDIFLVRVLLAFQ